MRGRGAIKSYGVLPAVATPLQGHGGWADVAKYSIGSPIPQPWAHFFLGENLT